jgi:hypothetical protein
MGFHDYTRIFRESKKPLTFPWNVKGFFVSKKTLRGKWIMLESFWR